MIRTPEIILQELTEAHAQRDILNIDQARKLDEAMPDSVKKALAEIATEYMSMHQLVDEKIAALEDEAKEAVLTAGETCKGGAFQAVFTKGKVTWNTEMLDGMIALLPEIGKARKEGKPSVSLRRSG